jgi:cytochrome P450
LIPADSRLAESAPLPPHPKDLPLIGSMPDFARDILGTIFGAWRAHGDVVRFRGLNEMCLVAHPDHVEHVLERRLDIYPRSNPVKDYLRPIMGQGLLISEGALWSRQRRLVAPLTHGRQAADLCSAISDATAAWLDRLRGPAQRGEPIDIKAEMIELGIDIIGRTILGGSRGDPLTRKVASAIEYAGPRVMMPVNPPDRLTPKGRRYLRTLRELDEELQEEIAGRRGSARPSADLLSMLVKTRDADTGEGMPDRLVRDEALTAVFGMYKGIPPGLTWAFYLLAQYPEAGERLRAELDEVLAGRAPTMDDLPHLRYTRMVVDETLRLYPPLWIFSRPAGERDVIGGYRIEKGVFVLIIPYVTHRHPAFWDQPDVFDPGRFAPDRVAERHPYAYIPFGGGPRRCTGDELGPMALCLAMAAIAQRYRPRLVDAGAPEQSLEFLLRPKRPLFMRLEPLTSR